MIINDNQPLVSVGIPTYNRPKTLKRAIDSVMNQTYSNVEIIISDNCSTDKGVEKVINEYSKDARVKFIKQPVNKGLTFNFNFLLTQATGSYFMWLADDDWLALNYVESCLSFLLTNPDYAAAYGAGEIYSPRGDFHEYDVKINLEHSSYDARMKWYLEQVLSNSCLSALIPTRYKDEMWMKDVIAGDWLIVLRLAYLGKYKMLETTNVYISYGGLSSTLEGLTRNMSTFTRAFPYFTIGLNIMKDILITSKTYKQLTIFKRMHIAKECFLIVFKRHNVRVELKPGLKKYIFFKKDEIKGILKKVGLIKANTA